MEDRSLDELGPVDYLIVEFPAGAQNFTGEGADELLRLHDAGIIRIMDILILIKNEDGSVDAQELSDLPELGELRQIEGQLAKTLAEEDVENLAAAMMAWMGIRPLAMSCPPARRMAEANGAAHRFSQIRTPAVLPGSMAAARSATSSAANSSASSASIC